MMKIEGKSEFFQEIAERSGEEINRCYLCKKCTSGCPMAFAMDYQPHQLIRLLQYGKKEKILESSIFELCISCETCAARCPNDINIAAIVDALRQYAFEEDHKSSGRDVLKFHREFLDNIRRRGRVHEVDLLARYKIKTLNLFEDLAIGWKLFRRGKLPLKGEKVEDRDEIEKIFSEFDL